MSRKPLNDITRMMSGGKRKKPAQAKRRPTFMRYAQEDKLTGKLDPKEAELRWLELQQQVISGLIEGLTAAKRLYKPRRTR